MKPSSEFQPRFVRTLLGDLPATRELGICDAHEHVIIRGEWIATHFPDILLDDEERILVDLQDFKEVGGGWIVDSMPTRAGRDAALLAQVANKSGIPIVCPTGVHQPKYYAPHDPLVAMNRESLAKLFIREITRGIDDGAERPDLRAGVVKVANSGARLTDIERERFAAAAICQRETGCPILTHTEAGSDAYEQAIWLRENGASPSQVVLSHCDKRGDLAYHRDLLQTGICLEYDQHFRQVLRGEPCHSVDLIVSLIDEFPYQLLVGMDMARRVYWKGHGGRPGLSWLVREFVPRLRQAGLQEHQIDLIMIDNALKAFSFRCFR